MDVKITDLYDLNETIAKEYLEKFIYPWEALEGLKNFIIDLISSLPADEYDKISDDIIIHKTATIAKTASLNGPLIVCKDAEIRHCAFIRGSAIVGEGAVVGNSTELKNVILFNGVQVPHYNYVGDSILGYKAHMGAGSITSNVKADKKNVVIKCPDESSKTSGEKIETGRKKVGAMLGDFVEIGCNSVLNPGTVIGRNSNVYPCSSVRGVIPENSVYKKSSEIIDKYCY